MKVRRNTMSGALLNCNLFLKIFSYLVREYTMSSALSVTVCLKYWSFTLYCLFYKIS